MRSSTIQPYKPWRPEYDTTGGDDNDISDLEMTDEGLPRHSVDQGYSLAGMLQHDIPSSLQVPVELSVSKRKLTGGSYDTAMAGTMVYSAVKGAPPRWWNSYGSKWRRDPGFTTSGTPDDTTAYAQPMPVLVLRIPETQRGSAQVNSSPVRRNAAVQDLRQTEDAICTAQAETLIGGMRGSIVDIKVRRKPLSSSDVRVTLSSDSDSGNRCEAGCADDRVRIPKRSSIDSVSLAPQPLALTKDIHADHGPACTDSIAEANPEWYGVPSREPSGRVAICTHHGDLYLDCKLGTRRRGSMVSDSSRTSEVSIPGNPDTIRHVQQHGHHAELVAPATGRRGSFSGRDRASVKTTINTLRDKIDEAFRCFGGRTSASSLKAL